MSERFTEAQFIRPTAIAPSPEGKGCVVCGELHPVAEGPACSLNRTTGSVELPISAKKLMEFNEAAFKHNFSPVINESGVSIAIINEKAHVKEFPENADIYIQATDPEELHVDETLPLEVSEDFNKANAVRELVRAKFEEIAPRFKPFTKESRAKFAPHLEII